MDSDPAGRRDGGFFSSKKTFELGEVSVLAGQKIVVVMPAYNAAKTLKKTYDEVPKDIVDEILLVDDGSHDDTIELSRELGIRTFIHERNFGYGRNQKTCYREALKTGADIVVMLHPDYQYSPKLITAMVSLIAIGEYDVVIASRILGVGALKGGMPVYKYISNRFLTLVENLMLFHKLSEYHTGYRVFSRKVLESLPLLENSDDFVFDNEMLAQIIFWNYRIGEISCPTKYFPEASMINFSRSLKYGLGCLLTSLKFRIQKMHLGKFRVFDGVGRKLFEESYYRPVLPEKEQESQLG
jgi:glycosyltransferase involved in cell wall biosynthesis